jgi:hypothetical protein
MRVMVHDGDAVGGAADVELHSIGTQIARHRERLQRVLARVA